ncbi:MAG: polymerase subunit sigma-70, partial [Variovorax sp.]|nr:polymerase subunit sigma-70 [Variovorax sp.]
MLVTFDAKHRQLVLQRVGGFQESPDKSLQLWALPPGGTPRSLGVLGREPGVRMTAAPSEVQVPALAITLEPKGGVPPGSPATGPILFKGALIPKTM